MGHMQVAFLLIVLRKRHLYGRKERNVILTGTVWANGGWEKLRNLKLITKSLHKRWDYCSISPSTTKHLLLWTGSLNPVSWLHWINLQSGTKSRNNSDEEHTGGNPRQEWLLSLSMTAVNAIPKRLAVGPISTGRSVKVALAWVTWSHV